MLSMAKKWLPAEGWCYLLLLTDLPRIRGSRPVLASVNLDHRVALLSLPAVGWFRLRRHVRDGLVHLLGVLFSDALPGTGHGEHRIRRRPSERTSPVRQLPFSDHDTDLYLVLTGARGWLRLLFGTVRDNRPWRLVPGMSKALAAATAAAAFGIFYPTIWGMADALSPTRLALINLVAVTAMVVWLIAHHGLWDRARERGDRGASVLYNTASVVTLFLGVGCMYVVLFAGLLLCAAAVISADYLQARFGHPVTLGDYVALVWLASSLGTVAGAVGSTLERTEDLRRAAYSKREQQRRARRRAEQEGEVA